LSKASENSKARPWVEQERAETPVMRLVAIGAKRVARKDEQEERRNF